ncbi:MAG: CRISPR-associated helicase Cas3' [Alphaproteobacteria bacterium]|jgi:CRISPR-associated endonuclease/helicase Cas3|nr:CRISPR-associated helicase Cas3' [Alphaproteobacteria bacterium]
MEMFYAHTRDDEKQQLKEHLKNVAILAGNFASSFNAKEIAELVGWLHDLGKYSKDFQKRLAGSKQSVNHSSAGGIEITKLAQGDSIKQLIAELLAFCILGHHAGLPDKGPQATSSTLEDRLNPQTPLPTYESYKNEVNDEVHKLLTKLNSSFPKLHLDSLEEKDFVLSFFTRMLFSCLVDADFLDTESFMQKGKVERENFASIENLFKKFNNYISEFAKTNTEINKKRTEILNECITKGKTLPKGFYTISVPTGGGKTISSMAFALNHAITHKQNRIIYTIPYTSIIEQNAEVFKNIFGEENVLEHHSNYSFEELLPREEKENEEIQRLKLATQNWQAPIVVSTNVQFFESLFANKTSRCRKLHNIVNSVIILDEAQMLSTFFLKPCLAALEELVKNYNCTVVLCTATQPNLEKYTSLKSQEIVSNQKALQEFFKRVEVEYIGKKTDNELVAELVNQDSSLVIVNTKKHAKELYQKMVQQKVNEKQEIFHLSTFMCAIHRKEVIFKVKKRLENNLTTVVISTQLIEAGVDVDFPIVYRSSAGLDSIIQSAGRCNRNAKLEKGIVKVFNSSEDYSKVMGFLQRTQGLGEDILQDLKDFQNNPISNEAVATYFEKLYKNEDLDEKDIIEKCKEYEFKKVADNFKLIEDNKVNIIIPYNDKAIELIEQLKYTEFPKSLLKQLQPFTVSVYENHYLELIKRGSIKDIFLNNENIFKNNNLEKGIIVLTEDSKDYEYSQEDGLKSSKETQGEAIFL